MKLLRIKAEGLPLFKETLDLSFYAQQRVCESDKEILYPAYPGVYTHGANAFIGINASGKTSVLKVILLALGILNNQPINHIEGKEILGATENAVLDIYFYAKPDAICLLRTEITSTKTKGGEIKYSITAESLWENPLAKKVLKAHMFDFAEKEPTSIRQKDEAFLPDDVSFIIARNKREKEAVEISSLLSMTNVNVLPVTEEIPAEIITFLDPTVESLYFEQKNGKALIHLKFRDKEEILLNSSAELEQYLSSGTIKGIVTFMLAENTLKTGGYFVIDEIENHFNREIVATLMRFFMDARLNKNGGTLIFTTHYPELMDEYDRNDGIYIIRNRNGITVSNLSDILKRNDLKKSDAYESGYLEGTTPAYDAYLKLKKSISEMLS